MNPTPPSTPEPSRVAVVLTSYNHQGFIEQCLESIAAQTRPGDQVIIIDDCSTDASVDVIDRWLAHTGNDYQFYRHTQNQGLPATLNEALALIDCPYYIHISSDDWEDTHRIERQLRAFEAADHATAIVVGDIREVDVGGATIVDHDFGLRLRNILASTTPSDQLSFLLSENAIPAPGVMLRTSAVRSVGGYDETLDFEDYDMWMRLTAEHLIGYSPGIVANYRVIATSMLRSPKRRVGFLTSEATMLAKHIGSSPSNDATITSRLLGIARDLITLDDASAVRVVLGFAARSSSQPWIDEAILTTRHRDGLGRLVRAYGDRLGLQPAKVS